MSASDSDDDAYGPILPPSMKCGSKRDEAKTKSLSNKSKVEDEDAFLPALPPHSLKTRDNKEVSRGSKSVASKTEGTPDKHKEEKDDSLLPALPPHLLKTSGKKELNEDNKSSNLHNIGASQKLQGKTFKRINETVTEPSQRKAVQKGCEPRKDCLSDDDDDVYGPALPPHLLKKKEEKNSADRRNIPGSARPAGTIPSVKSIQKDSEQKKDLDDDDDGMYGAALPPHLLNKKQDKNQNSEKRILGPTLPRGFIPPEESFYDDSDDEEKSEGEDSGGLVIGPTPSTQKFDEKEYRMQQLEYRALKMKEKLEGKDNDDNKPLVRESWMIELPEDKPNFIGLGPRQFLRKTPKEKGDRSMWTDTPADKERKAQMATEEQEEPTPVYAATKRRDEELSEQVDEYNKAKRAKPLIDLHRKNLKEKEDAAGPKERRPFSRELDMNVNKFDEAQKSSILKKARKLNDRFSAGQAKFL